MRERLGRALDRLRRRFLPIAGLHSADFETIKPKFRYGIQALREDSRRLRFYRYTAEGRGVLAAAFDLLKNEPKTLLRTEHLLVAVMESRSAAADVLLSRCFQPVLLKDRLMKSIRDGAERAAPGFPYTTQAKAALLAALEKSNRQYGRAGPEHILWGLFVADDSGALRTASAFVRPADILEGIKKLWESQKEEP